MRVVNLYGGPSTGKSTTRANLFGLMKGFHHRVEEATEFAKELTYRRDWESLKNQGFVTAGQEERLSRLADQVDWCISDSPLPLGIFYSRGTRYDNATFHSHVWGLFDHYENVNVFIRRVKPYQEYGRSQTEDEARAIDDELRTLMAGRIDFEVDGDAQAHHRIYERLSAC